MFRCTPLLGLLACSEYDLAKFDGVDVFYQDPPAEVDVLLVVDNSCSMAPFQEKLASEFDGFVSFFTEAKVNYQIGVVTTAVAPSVAVPGVCPQAQIDAIPPVGELVQGVVLTADTPKADEVFAELVSVGTCGSGSEMGLEASWVALTEKADGANAGFLRESAMLSVLYVSDEQDSSPSAVHTYLNGFQTQVKDPAIRGSFNASGFVVTSVDKCLGEQANFAHVGSRYLEMIGETKGVTADICADDYSAKITELSLKAARLQDTFYLSKEPDTSTLLVEVDGVEVPCSSGRYTFERVEDPEGGAEDVPAIVFNHSELPPSGATVLVSYYQGVGEASEFCPDEGV